MVGTTTVAMMAVDVLVMMMVDVTGTKMVDVVMVTEVTVMPTSPRAPPHSAFCPSQLSQALGSELPKEQSEDLLRQPASGGARGNTFEPAPVTLATTRAENQHGSPSRHFTKEERAREGQVGQAGMADPGAEDPPIPRAAPCHPSVPCHHSTVRSQVTTICRHSQNQNQIR